MNKQKPNKGIEWTRIIQIIDGLEYELDGFTWNPVGGCFHECAWYVGDKNLPKEQRHIAICYAKLNAESRYLQKQYPEGFEHIYWHPERLEQPLKVKKAAGIFLDSMSDLMGPKVSDEYIKRVLDVCYEANWHIFLLLTKNFKQLNKFQFPDNVWVGVSSPPDFMNRRELDHSQKLKYMDNALRTLHNLRRNNQAKITWMSLEPLTMDWSGYIREHEGALSWATVGAASIGKEYFAPEGGDIANVVAELERQEVPVFYKGNMVSSPYAKANWKKSFPAFEDYNTLTLF